MSEPLRVALVGARGRMGRFAAQLLRSTPGHVLVAELGRGCDLARELRRSEARVGLDLTVAGLGAGHGRLMLEAGLRPVIGTSGVSLDETRELDARARALGLGGLVVPNFSLGMVRLQELALQLAGEFPRAEIVEGHHDGKRDAPSGTALETAERLQAAGTGPVPIHSLRLPGLFARHEILFGAAGETLALRHECRGPEAFAAGILRALAHASTALGVERGLRHALRAP